MGTTSGDSSVERRHPFTARFSSVSLQTSCSPPDGARSGRTLPLWNLVCPSHGLLDEIGGNTSTLVRSSVEGPEFLGVAKDFVGDDSTCDIAAFFFISRKRD